LKKLAIISTHPIQYQIPLFKSLKKKGINSKVFFASKHGIVKNKIDPEFLRKIKWDINSNMLEGFESKFSKIQKYNIDDFRLSYFEIEKELIKENFDHILILGWNNLHYLRAIYFAIKKDIKIILRVETNLKSTKNFFKRVIKKIILKYFFQKVSYFLSIGKLNKEFYIFHDVKQKKILPAPYFVDNNFFNLRLNKNILKKKFKLRKKKVVLFVGKLIERKNPFEFLELAKLNKNNSKFHFLIIGDGILKRKCFEYIKSYNLKNISLVGFVNQKKLREYYIISDLMIITSFYETWGLTINEAFAANIPVVCSKGCGASYDLLENGKTGFIYNTGNINHLNKKTKLILNNKKLSLEMTKNIKTKIKKYSLTYTLDSIDKILNEK
jgi:glycosyltransferase involved in cell wall biosynthesis